METKIKVTQDRLKEKQYKPNYKKFAQELSPLRTCSFSQDTIGYKYGFFSSFLVLQLPN